MTRLCTKRGWYYCLSVGVLMNTRGIVQLVVLNIGVQLKILSEIIFALFVLMATILTIITSPVIQLLLRKEDQHDNDEIETASQTSDTNTAEQGPAVIGTIVTMPACPPPLSSPRRIPNMTRF